MRFGNCLNLVPPANGGDRRILDLTLKAGFDYVEAGLSELARAADAEFDAVRRLCADLGLTVPVCNGMFPPDIRLTADGADFDRIRAYTDGAFARAKCLGVEKVVLGSDKSRRLPEGYAAEAGFADMIRVVKECIAPLCEKHGITVLIEPLRRPACNFLNTLADGMRVVDGVDHPQVQLIADTIHMIHSGEDPDSINRYLPHLLHVHVSDWERRLPQYGFSRELTPVIRTLALSCYDGDYSFEVRPDPDDLALQRALLLLKAALGA